MTILGIETSCDDTGIALIEAKQGRIRVLANLVSSQAKLHQKYGGVYPTLAKREHQKNLPLLFKKALKKNIDAVAVTQGPGLDPCLWTGIEFAKNLAKTRKVPIIPVNHIEGHLLISLLASNLASPSLKLGLAKFDMPNAKKVFPAIALIVSGGHTQLIFVRKVGKYEILGETRDDAAGECFDKTARILGLPYPGGPAIAKLAHSKLSLTKFTNLVRLSFDVRLPRPMLHTKDYDFSFSGLKTAVLYDYQKRSPKVRKSKEYIQAMAGEIQQAAIDVLLAKTLRALGEYNAHSLILGGGVAANMELRKQLKQKLAQQNTKLFAAPPALCTDNGLMIALAGYVHFKQKTKNIGRIGAKPNLRLQ